MHLRTGRWGEAHCASVGFASVLVSKVGWWDDGPQFKPKFCKEMNSVIIDHNSNCCFSVAVILSSSCLSCSQLSHRHLCCVLSSCIPPQTPYPKCSHFPLLIPFELHALTCRLLVSGVFQLPVLHCHLFLDSLLSQPSNTQSVVPFLVLSSINFSMHFSCGAAQLLLSGLSLLHPDLREDSPSFPVPIFGATKPSGNMWSLGYIQIGEYFRSHRQTSTEKDQCHKQCFQINLF